MTISDPREWPDAYRAAVDAKNVDAFVALYDPDLRAFDLWGEWVYQGRGAWRGMVEGWFGSLGEERVGVDFADVQTTVSGDLAVLSAFVTYRGLSAAGEELRSLTNRMTAVLRRSEASWRVLHEHSSGPADPQTGKVMLRR